LLELVGGIIAIVVGVIMLIIGGAIINTVSTGGGIGDCDAQDYNGDGLTGLANDSSTTAYKQCNGTKNNGYTILNIISVMMIIGGVIASIKGFT
jgi:uncharacterized membrane protein